MSDLRLTLLDGVRCGGVAVPGERSHALLASLAHAAPRAVGVRDLVGQVWPDGEPEHPEKALQVLVSRTRSRTAPGVVVHDGAGYRLGLRDDQVDALRLRRLIQAALAARDAGDLDVARHTARDALAVPITTAAVDGPLADLADAARHDQARARRLLGSVLLARGDAGEALGLLELALADDAGDEDLVAEVLRAEAAVRGVPAALARYAAHAARVLDEVGAEPGEALRRLHLELLARDAPVREGLKYDASPMVGRDDVVADLRALLAGSRVVSLVGAGGLGKTRTAHLVGRLAQQPVVHFIELAGVNAPEGVLPEVAMALGVREGAAIRAGKRGTDLRARLAEQLSGPPTLLILDNCEHVIGAAAELVSFIVAATAGTTVLTTSRAPLGIAAEQVYALPQLDEGEAVELFGQRARAARAGVRLDPGEVRALVGRLDGLPLAIELAAAKVRAMSVADITRRLGDRFALLCGGDRSAPDRHRTLEAVIEWSWVLLRADDQSALSSLATFPDGFSLDGAEALLGRDPLPALTELLDQSLLVVREGDHLRYRFLETVREYGLKQLAAGGDGDAVRVALRGWATATARRLSPGLQSRDQIAAVHQVRAEAGNLSGLMRTAFAEGDVETLVPLVGLLAEFWTIEGDHLTVMGLAQAVLDLIVAEPTPAGIVEEELSGAISLLTMNDVFIRGRSKPAAVDRLRRLGHHGADGGIAELLVEIFTPGPDLDADRLAALTHAPDVALRRTALMWMSQVTESGGDVTAALDCGLRALALCDELPDEGPWMRALIQSQVAGHATQVGDWDLCVRLAAEAAVVMEALGSVEDSLQLRSVIALADLSQGRLEQARAAFAEITADERGQQTFGWSFGLVGQAELALAEGDVDGGLVILRGCVDNARVRGPQAFGEDRPGPWNLFIEAATIFASVLHGRRSAVDDLVEVLRGRIAVALADPSPAGLDFPVAGCVLVALGTWDLTGPDPDVERAVRAVALARRFTYSTNLPSMAWPNVERVVEAAAPGALARLVGTYDDRLPAQLREEAAWSVEAERTPGQSTRR